MQDVGEQEADERRPDETGRSSARAPAERASPDGESPPLGELPAEAVRARVLFMDDEEPIRVMTQALLEGIGLEVVATESGCDAVRAYAQAQQSGRPFNLVIFDLTVAEGLNGCDAMQEILKLDPAAKGIVSSGYANHPVTANFQAHGFRASVPKPYRLSDFARTIREVLAGP